ncbi:MAG: energy transducer TonB [Thermodesulfobacteriota bacterium]|nr:energy transducer TonB [Thermodesulfobacteriota bacterium]
MPSWEGRPNWLLRGLILISIAIHMVIFMHITGLYRSRILTYIELTLKDISKPPTRSIPRPRQRPKNPPHTWDVKRMKVIQRPIPQLKPISIEPAERNLPDSLVERVSMPDIPQDQRLNITEWSPPEKLVVESDYATPNSYMEIIRLMIEKHKRYPSLARIKNIEGRVIIRFMITPQGDAKNVEIARSSRSKILDGAALKAVNDASPFPKPPGNIYQGELSLEVNIVFELK